jgi:polyhydroxyalkanoate synthesis regulator protein
MANAAPVTRLIRRYAGARFYDADAASYVSLQEILGLANGQERVRVVDAITGSDITEAVLAEAKVCRH